MAWSKRPKFVLEPVDEISEKFDFFASFWAVKPVSGIFRMPREARFWDLSDAERRAVIIMRRRWLAGVLFGHTKHHGQVAL